MKFLCDVHLTLKLVRYFQSKGIETVHANDLPNRWYTTDTELSDYADAGGFVVISKDIDFLHSHLVYDKPKRLIRVTLGNTSNADLIKSFELHLADILSYESHESFHLAIGKFGLIHFAK